MQKPWIIWTAALSFALYAHVSPGQVTPSASQIVDANTKFAFKLFKQVAEQSPEHNVLVAPTGLSLTFGLLANGSDPTTQRQIASTFEFGGTPIDQINEGFAALRGQLFLERPHPPTPAHRSRPNPDLPPPIESSYNPNGVVIADSLWGSQYFRASFHEISQKYYRVEMKQTRLSSQLSRQVSLWASQKIGKEVPLELGSLANSNFLLVDVTRFHSFWRNNFDMSQTKPAPFTLQNGQQKSVPMMYRQANFSYLERPEFQAVRLPYREDYSFYLFLPSHNSSLKELEQTLTADSWRALLKDFTARDGLVGLPRFKVETGYDLRAALRELGLQSIFESFAAFRPAVTMPEGARLANAFQKTTLSLDEKGTEAISVAFGGGVIGGVEGGIPGERPKPFVMIADRPFLFAIQHNQTGQILFLGAILEP